MNGNFTPRRPKMLFFRSVRLNLPGYIQLHLQQQIDCLRQFFDVVVLEPDCDFQQVCDTHEPDLALFESSVYSGKRSIRNIQANSRVLRAGLFNSDAYCITRSSFASDMAEWGIDTYFSISVSLAEYFPSIAENLFCWPNFVDDQIYRDYGLPKSIPVLFTGSQATHYPWRNTINRFLSQSFPTLSMPHFGWFNAAVAQRMIFGEEYARMLSSAVFAPTCGTIAKEVVRKIFEIPACGTILVTERTPALDAAGFVDLQNCVFAEPSTVIEKLDHLFAHKEMLASISQAGRELVHARHTSRSRDQIFQWYRLRTASPPGSRIVQTTPFGPLALAAQNSKVRNGHVISRAVDRAVLQQAAQLLTAGNIADAEQKFRACLNYHLMPEPLLGLARCSLRNAAPKDAEAFIRKSVNALLHHLSAEPDPVEWSYLIVCALARGDRDGAIALAGEYPALRHALLDQARQLVHLLYPENFLPRDAASTPERASVHDPFTPSFDEWHAEILQALRSGGQPALAARVAELRDELQSPHGAGERDTPAALVPNPRAKPANASLPARALGFARHWARTARETISRRSALKGAQRSDFANAVLHTWQRDNPRFTLILGGYADSSSLLQAAQKNPLKGQIAISGDAAEWTGADASDARALATVTSDQPIEAIRTRLGALSFDAVIVFAARGPAAIAAGDLLAANYVAINGINDASLQPLFAAVLAGNTHELIYFEPAGHGQAILQRALDAGVRRFLAAADGVDASREPASMQLHRA